MNCKTDNASALKTLDRRTNYNGIDLAKFICAILVFVIHIAPFRRYSLEYTQYLNQGLQYYLCRVAVPFYFVSSGFFLFRKVDFYDLQADTVKAYCFKLIRLIGLWSILLVLGGTEHLWYLGATAVAVVFLYLCLHIRMRLRYIYLLAFGLYLIGLTGDSYYGLIEPLKEIRIIKYVIMGYEFFFQHTRNGIFMGFIFVLMGATFARFQIRIPIGMSLLGLILSMLFLLVEVSFLMYHSIPRDYNMYLFLLPAVFFMFHLASNVTLRDSFVYRWLRNISVLIYFLHEQINQVAILGVRVFKRITGIRLTPYQFIVSLALTLFVAVVLTYLSRKEKFKWLRWLYS